MQQPFNINHFKNQIAQQYLFVSTEKNTYPFTLEEVANIFIFYYEEYKKHMHQDHPILSNSNMKQIIENLPFCMDSEHNDDILTVIFGSFFLYYNKKPLAPGHH